MKRIFLFLIINFILINCNASIYEKFLSFPVLHEGRIKPFDSFANNVVSKIFINQININLDIKNLLIKLILNDSSVLNEKLFLISNKNILSLIKITDRDVNNKYSFNDIINNISNNLELIDDFVNKKSKIIYFDQKNLLDLYVQILFFIKLNSAFEFFHSNYFFLNDKFYSEYEISISKIQNFDLLFKHNVKFLKFKFFLDKLNFKTFDIFYLDKLNWIKITEKNKLNQYIDNEGLYLINKVFKTFNNLNFYDHYSLINIYKEYTYLILGPFICAKIFFENFYNKLNLFKLSVFLFMIIFIINILNFFLKYKNSLHFLSFLLLILFNVLMFFSIFLRCLITEKPPVTNLFESMIFVNFLLSFLLCLFVRFIDKKYIFLYGSIFMLFLQYLIYRYSIYDGDIRVLTPVLDTNFWLSTHVIIISIGYALCLSISFLSHISLYFCVFKKIDDYLNTKISNFIYFLCNSAIFFSLLGTILGGIWADHSWGRFWGWDPKENGALFIVFWLVFMVHFKNTGWFNPFLWSVFGVLTSVVIALAWFGVNLLGAGLHSYGFVQGIGHILFYFCLFEFFYVFIFCFLFIKKN